MAVILDSIVVSIPACHAGDRGSIPRRGDNILVDAVIICILVVIKIALSSETLEFVPINIIAPTSFGKWYTLFDQSS